MKRHQLLMLEWSIDSLSPKQLREMDAMAGGALGAGAGALGAAGIWAVKRLQLKRKMDACPDDSCRQEVQAQIADLRKKALMGGAAATAAGGALGAGATQLFPHDNTHEVKSGENLSTIVASHLKQKGAPVNPQTIMQGVQTAATTNKIKNPDLIYPGQRITV